MQLFEWTPKLETGIAVIDKQHHKLVDIVNELNEAMRKGHGKDVLDRILAELKDYTSYHFGTEEKAFKDYAYPKAEEHGRQHAELVAQLNDLVDKHARGQFLITVDILEFLKSWLSEHILKRDMEYVPTLKGKAISS